MPRGVPQGRLLAPFLLLAVTAAMASSEEGEGPVVRVAQGALRGRRIQRPEGSALRTVYAFEGVPYARPPLGDRRFKDPEEAEPWDGVRNATAFGPHCVQRDIITGSVAGEEDCLYLNIYTADPPATWTTQKRAVLVFIHGGAFVQSSGDMSSATPDLLLQRGVIFVIFNYRLGVMGFLNTEDGEVPGNAAMKDQVMVLRWVQRNIGAFGGDNSNVTIMGTSSGGCSVHYHLLSPLSKGLFHRAVSSSGTALASWALEGNPRRIALALRRRWAEALCPSEEEESIAACLRRVPATDLVASQYDVPTEENRYFFWNSYYVPSLEAPNSTAPFISRHPRELLQEGRFRREIPYVTGSTTAEGILYLTYGRLNGDASRWATLNANFSAIFRWELPFGVAATRDNVDAVRSFYFGNDSLSDGDNNLQTQRRFVQMVTDMYYFSCSADAAHLMSREGGQVYVYQFSRDGPIDFTKEAFNASHIPGAMHGDDMPYLFDFLSRGEPIPIPASEQPIRERQATLFTNFAKSGDPTPPGSGLVQWPPVTPQNENYLDMDEDLSVGSISTNERIIFWRSLMNQ